MSKTSNIPAHQGLQASGVKYNMSAAGNAGLQAFVTAATQLSPVAYQLQGYQFNGSIFNPTVDRISQAIAGQITLDQAYQRIAADVADALATAKK